MSNSACRLLMLSVLALFVSSTAHAAVKLGAPFVDHMVLQRGKTLPVWGTADAGTDVTVSIGERHTRAKTDANDHWQATFAAIPAGGPFKLTATAAAATATIDDVLIGDVWLCSGQSNMQFSLKESVDGPAVAAQASRWPELRLAKVGMAWESQPTEKLNVKWTAATPQTAVEFSAVGYYFAHELYSDPAMKDVPVGMVEDCLGATVIESWMPAEQLAQFDKSTLASSMFGIGPTLLYNGMIAPLKNTAFTGVIWYQGEGNAGQPERYAQYLPLMMSAWRKQFGQPELPFLIVQLPDYATDWGGVYWQWMRAAQAKAVAQTPHAYLGVSVNTNDGWNLHPQGKHEIGRRLSLLARQGVYGEQVGGISPTFKEAKVDGPSIRVTFDTAGSHLTSGSSPVEGFDLAGEDGEYHAATATIDGPDAVIVTSKEVASPQTARFAWAGVPRSTLTNAAGIPVTPFRTDTQPLSKGHGEVIPSPLGYQLKGPDYEVMIDGNGRATSLIVHNQQLLSNAPGKWGGSSLMSGGNQHGLQKITMDGVKGLTCSGDELIETFRFDDTVIHWHVANHSNDLVTFSLALSPLVHVSKMTSGSLTIDRKNAKLKVSGLDTSTTYQDIAADTGKVLQFIVLPGQTRTLSLNLVK